jgi:hypothetical protein
MSVSKNNRELLVEIKSLIGNLKDQVADIKQDISKIKNTQLIQSMKDRVTDGKEKYQIVEPKESTSWFW